ncbi:carbonic anhydrase [Methylocystis heyeri]|uniref:carbonic anhydrase n=1 Tax=Methylocystis heyeri TaxID=391905 RepID=A0A6B8KDG2_9HYPH|nr:carbonic anhydrase family protein [Methylocystis heyeri]QGM46286.1 carbonic anhydrase family protein [Methylocystis heyeri]
MLHRRKFLLGLMACPLCARGAVAEGPHWEYETPGAWGELDPAYKVCAVGQEQSPIDLKDAISADFGRIAIDWKPQAFPILNNGHTIQADAGPGAGSLRIGKEKYELKQFHFHTPAEHAVNGKLAAMEVHFVHARADGKLAVVGAFLNGGGKNSAFSRIMKAAPTTQGEARLDKPLNPRTLAPAQGPIFRYEGSLTTPPCSEIVDWNIFAAPVRVAQADIDAFRKIFPHNARPLQGLNRRFVLRGK